MAHWIRHIAAISVLAFSAPLFAQENSTEGETETTEEVSPDPLELNMGDQNTEGEANVGDIYVRDTFDDWELRCVVGAEGQKDPCQLYQLLKDEDGNSVAEINMFPLPGGENQPSAGATVITPLETLLTESLGLSVDGSAVRKYPFSWCSQIGCFSRLGFSEEDVNAFRRGISASLIIVPVVAPDQKVSLMVSLKGFTAGFQAAIDAANE